MNVFRLMELIGGENCPPIDAEFVTDGIKSIWLGDAYVEYYLVSNVDTVVYTYIDGVVRGRYNLIKNVPTVIKSSISQTGMYTYFDFSLKFNSTDIIKFGYSCTGWEQASLDISMFSALEMLRLSYNSFYAYNTDITVDLTSNAKLKKVISSARTLLVTDNTNVLEYIDMAHTSGSIGDIALYTSLQYLKCAIVNIDNATPTDFTNNTLLEELTLTSGSITVANPLILTGLTVLDKLTLEVGVESGAIDLTDVPQLTELVMETTDIPLTDINTLVNLTRLQVTHTYQTPAGSVMDFSALVNLTHLHVYSVWNDPASITLPANTNIIDLYLYFTSAFTYTLSITHLVNLESLTLQYYDGTLNPAPFVKLKKWAIGSHSVMPNLALFPDLEHLQVGSPISPAVNMPAVPYPEKIKYLSVGQFANSIDYSLYTNLETLYISRNYYQGTINLQNNTKIKKVYAANLNYIAVVNLDCTNCTALEDIQTSGIKSVTLTNTPNLTRCFINHGDNNGSVAGTLVMDNCARQPWSIDDELFITNQNDVAIMLDFPYNCTITNCTVDGHIDIEQSPAMNLLNLTGTSANYLTVGSFNMTSSVVNNVTLSEHINSFTFNCITSTATKNAHMIYLDSLGTSDGTYRCTATNPITGEGLTARANLIARGWTIDDDN